MREFNEIRDDQIRVIGEESEAKKSSSRRVWFFVLGGAVLALIGAVVILLVSLRKHEEIQELKSPEPALFEPVEQVAVVQPKWIGRQVDSLAQGFTEIKDTMINDIPMRLFIPHNAEMTLHLGRMDKEDESVIYAAQAADVRADNGGIVGAFVLKGEPKAWGLSKKGYCAAINGKVTIGVAENTSLFEEATMNGGYFFRQYPLVKDGEVIDNEPKGKSIRRAICDRQGEIFMVETGAVESFHDFAQALADLGVGQAVYLVGSSAYGWAVDEAGATHEFGEDNYYKGRRRMPKNTSYIVWRKK
jgi:hypothetical protein